MVRVQKLSVDLGWRTDSLSIPLRSAISCAVLLQRYYFNYLLVTNFLGYLNIRSYSVPASSLDFAHGLHRALANLRARLVTGASGPA